MKKAIIHSTNSHGAGFFLMAIEAAIFLHKTRKYEVIEIKFHPVMILHKYTLVFELINLLFKDRKKFLRLFGTIKVQARDRSLLAKEKLNNKNSLDHESIYKSVIINKEKSSLKIGSLFIQLTVVNFSLDVKVIRFIKRAYCTAKTVMRNNSPSRAVLNLEVGSWHIGDLIASHLLRYHTSLEGKLKNTFNPFLIVLSAELIVNHCKNIHKAAIERKEDNYILVAEQTYLHGIYKRVLSGKGFDWIDRHKYDKPFSLVKATEVEANHSDRIYKRDLFSLTPFQKQLVATHMSKRIKNSKNELWYLGGSGNNLGEELLTDKGDVVDISSRTRIVLLFLPGFDDGQYYFGVSDFDDLYSWVEFTIKTLLKNKEVDKILIKPHPSNKNKKNFPASYAAINSLKLEYNKHDCIEWIDPVSSIAGLTGRKNFLAITFHGSVTEELLWLKCMVLTSVYGTWCDIVLTNTWKTRGEYGEQLSSYGKSNSKLKKYPVSDLFYMYIYKLRMTAIEPKERYAWIKYAEMISGKSPVINSKNFKYWEGNIESNMDKILLVKFINYIEEKYYA
jgi:hypothetical protein